MATSKSNTPKKISSSQRQRTVKASPAGAEYRIEERHGAWYCFEKRKGRWIEHQRFGTKEEAEMHIIFDHESDYTTLAASSEKTTEKKAPKGKYVKNVRRDTLDFRDQMYKATLVEVPEEMKLENYTRLNVPILDQGSEGACTGYGLATVANYLLRSRAVGRQRISGVSPGMLYQLAKRYDEWAGEDYDGSSARGAMKGWHKHGVCDEALWKAGTHQSALTDERITDARKRPLGAYYRVNHKDLVAMHSAMAEVGILFATCTTHAGWDKVRKDGHIPFTQEIDGGHAFAIVAYNQKGFWIQNSWGPKWGNSGFALISYDDWLQNGTDVWVARLGVPVAISDNESVAISNSAVAKKSNTYTFNQLRPHVISLGNDGILKQKGEYGNSVAEVKSIIENDFENITKNWTKKRLLLYAHGGLVPEASAIQRVADYRSQLLEAEVYPLAFIWNTDAWTTLTNILKESVRKRKPEGFIDAAKDFLLDRLDDILEPIARGLTGKMQWDEIKENARLASSGKGGVRIALHFIAKLAAKYGKDFELHLIGHSAGSVLLGHLVAYLNQNADLKLKVESATLWAPACTLDLFKTTYLPAIEAKLIKRFAVFNLTDKAERDDHCAKIYNKSLLYLVSNAFEHKPRIPGERNGTPILGMEKCIKEDTTVNKFFNTHADSLILSPNAEPEGSYRHANCKTHGGFDDDRATVTASLCRILNKQSIKLNENEGFVFQRSQSSLTDRRNDLEAAISGSNQL